MKKLIIIATVLLTSTAFAKLNKNSSRKQIRRSNSVTVEAPQIAFSGSSTLYMSVLDVCQSAENEFRTARKVNVYKWVGSGDNASPEPVGKAYRYAPRSYSKQYCLKENCMWDDDFETVVTKRSLRYRIEILGEEVGDSGMSEVLFTKSYKIPVCD
ncbi:MAG: hypothetical protein HOO06_00205 [Bdellovibrionaceae bacterium]|nr:hypothetical protein [Pseudobdellovibrionaceae bacterium]